MRTTRAMINDKVAELASLTGLSNSRKNAQDNGRDSFLSVDHNSIYGGYRLVTVKVEGGAEHGAFGGSGTEARLSASAFMDKLNTLIAGYKAGKEAQQESEVVSLTRIDNDTNGNPRYVCHYLAIANNYDEALKLARTIGGRKFHNKQYGGGIAFQSYNTSALKKSILELKAGGQS